MATITIRNLDEKVKRKLQVRAALNGRSMEAEARDLISGGVEDSPTLAVEPEVDLGTAIHRRFAAERARYENWPDEQTAGPDRGLSATNPSLLVSHDGSDRKAQPLPTSDEPEEDLGTAIHRRFAALGGAELQIPPRRKSHRPIPTFD